MDNETVRFLTLIGVALIFGLMGLALGTNSTPADAAPAEQPMETPMEINGSLVMPIFNPRRREFKLDDGTPCVAVSTRATTFPHDSGLSGISCNWNYQKG